MLILDYILFLVFQRLMPNTNAVSTLQLIGDQILPIIVFAFQ